MEAILEQEVDNAFSLIAFVQTIRYLLKNMDTHMVTLV